MKSIEIREMLDKLNIQQYFTPTDRSEVNGIVERFHSTLAEMYRCNKHKFEIVTDKEKYLISCSLYNITSSTIYRHMETIQR